MAKPAGPTSHDIVALVRRLAVTRRVGHGGTLDPFATGVLPVFLGRATRLVEYHLGDRKRIARRSASEPSSTTDDLDGELTPVDGPGPDRSAVEAALAALDGTDPTDPAGLFGDQARWPPSLRARPGGGDAAARAARGDDRPTRARRLGRRRSRPADRGRRGRLLGRDVCPIDRPGRRCRDRWGGLPRGADPDRVRRVHASSGPIPLETIRAAAADGQARPAALLLPIDAGLDRFPRVVLTEAEIAAVGRGQFVRPSAGLPPLASPDERLIATDGERPAGGRGRDPRRPARPGQGPRRPARGRHGRDGARLTGQSLGTAMDVVNGIDAADRRDTGGCSSSSACSTGSIAATTTCWPISDGPRQRSAPGPPSSPSTRIPTRSSVGAAPPLLLDADERLARLAAAGVEVGVVQHFDAALRMTEYDAFVARIAGTGRAGRLPHDPRCRVRARPARHARSAGGARSGRASTSSSSRPFALEGRPVRSAAIRAAIAAGDLGAAPSSPRPTGRRDRRWSGRPCRSRSPWPCRRRAATAARIEPAWTPAGRVRPPVAEPSSRWTVASSSCRRPSHGSDAKRARVALGPRLPEAANPAILRRSKKQTSI